MDEGRNLCSLRISRRVLQLCRHEGGPIRRLACSYFVAYAFSSHNDTGSRRVDNNIVSYSRARAHTNANTSTGARIDTSWVGLGMLVVLALVWRGLGVRE